MNTAELKSKIDSYQSVLSEILESDLSRKERKRIINLTNRRLRNAFKKLSFVKDRRDG